MTTTSANENETMLKADGDLIATAVGMFYRNGYKDTSVEDVLTEARVSDSSSTLEVLPKEELILAALENWDHGCRAWLASEMESRGETPKDQVLALFDVLTDWFQSGEFKGCMFINATVEYAERDNPIHQAAADHKRRFASYVKKLVETAGAKNADAVTEQLMILMEGSIVTSHTFGNGDAGRAAREMAERILSDAIA